MSLTPLPSWQPTFIPHPLTPLLGRAQEVHDVESLLRNSRCRLVTLIGPGGVGKTRLALHVADALSNDFADGVVFIPLAPIHDPALVLSTVGQTLGVHDAMDIAFETRLTELLREQQLLLVLDNFEQVLAAAPSIASVLSACPQIKLLITSQAPLGIEGEQQFQVRPLPTPTPEMNTSFEIERFDAVELFVQRARAVNQYFVLTDQHAITVATICRQLDGLPLAIELAAARLNILSPEALLARLSNRLKVLAGDRRDVPDRLLTMRNAIAWSYELLTPVEQSLFRRLAVFSGGCALEAIESVFAVEAPADPAALDCLGRLVDHSLIRRVSGPGDESRFLILETLREFGLEQLEIHGEKASACEAHAEYFQAMAGSAGTHLTGPEQQAWLTRLGAEWDNLRAALSWSLASSRGDIALRICAGIWRFWSIRGLASEGRIWTAQALTASRDDRSIDHVAALFGAGYLAEDQNDLQVASACFQRSVDLAEAIGDKPGAARALGGLGVIYHDRSDYPRALELHARAKALAQEAGDERGIAVALGNMGTVYYLQGIYDQCEACWSETVRILKTLHDLQAEAMITSNLGAVAMECGDLDQARESLTRTLALQQQLGDRRSAAYTLTNLGEVRFRSNDFVIAGELYTEAIALFHEFGELRCEALAVTSMARMALAKGECSDAARMLMESTQTLTSVDDATSGAENIELLANVAVRCRAFEEAAELFGAAESIRQTIGAPARTSLQAENDEGRAAARRSLGEDAFTAMHRVGKNLDFRAASDRLAIIATHLVTVARDHTPINPSRATGIEAVDETNHPHHLTEREREVLRLLAEGETTRQIASSLCISPRTASTHVTNILSKLGVTSRTAAVAYALRIGLV